eukprot:2191400-Pleurochrysis_carterae.AAC.1
MAGGGHVEVVKEGELPFYIVVEGVRGKGRAESQTCDVMRCDVMRIFPGMMKLGGLEGSRGVASGV